MSQKFSVKVLALPAIVLTTVGACLAPLAIANNTAIQSIRLASIALIALVTLAAAFADLSGPDGGFDLSWHTIDGGGGSSSGGPPGSEFELTGTIGQPDAGVISGGSFAIAGGFWPGAGGPTTHTCAADVAPFPNGDGVVNVSDLLTVINGWGACPAPPASCLADVAPIGGDGIVNVSDLLAVINGWGMCP